MHTIIVLNNDKIINIDSEDIAIDKNVVNIINFVEISGNISSNNCTITNRLIKFYRSDIKEINIQL